MTFLGGKKIKASAKICKISMQVQVLLCITLLQYRPFSSVVSIVFGAASHEWLDHNVNLIFKTLCLLGSAGLLQICFYARPCSRWEVSRLLLKHLSLSALEGGI